MIETYLPLYRKYRPQSFADVVGQEAIKQTLGNALQQSRVAHAYLFCGPRGTGKTSTARIFAKSLNCDQGPTLTPCQLCASCTGITTGNALDVVEFDAASNSGVDDARELIENAQFAPMAGRFKIYIIDEVHMLSTAAFNALLKTLEEPPKNVVFIFATTEAHKVLPTIISRCQRFDFSRITQQDIQLRLRHICDLEGIPIQDEALMLIARQARGGLRDAVSMLDQVSVLSHAQSESITAADVLSFMGGLEEVHLMGVMQAIIEQDPNALIQAWEALQKKGSEPVQLVKELAELFRHLFLIQAVGAGHAAGLGLPLTENALSLLISWISKIQAPTVQQVLQQLFDLERNLRHTQHPALWTEVGLLAMAHRENFTDLASISERLTQLEQTLKQGIPAAASNAVMSTPSISPAKTPQAASIPVGSSSSSPKPPGSVHVSSAPVAQPASTPSQPGGLDWDLFLSKIPSPATRAQLGAHGKLLSVDKTQVVIGIKTEPNFMALNRPDKHLHMVKAAEAILGHTVEVKLSLSQGGPEEAPEIHLLKTTVIQEDVPLPSLPVVKTSQAVNAPQMPFSPSQVIASPPVSELEEPPVFEEPPDEFNVHAIKEDGNTLDLDEAKKIAVDLFRGKILD